MLKSIAMIHNDDSLSKTHKFSKQKHMFDQSTWLIKTHHWSMQTTKLKTRGQSECVIGQGKRYVNYQYKNT